MANSMGNCMERYKIQDKQKEADSCSFENTNQGPLTSGDFSNEEQTNDLNEAIPEMSRLLNSKNSENANIPITKRRYPSSPKSVCLDSIEKLQSLSEDHSENNSGDLVGQEFPISKLRLQQSASQLIEDINEKRKQNNEMIDEFRQSQIAVVEKVCCNIENNFIATYTKFEPQVQEKLQQLFDTFTRIEQLETELEEFKSALSNLCRDMMIV